MKYLFASIFAFALVASTALGQSQSAIDTAVGLVQPPGPQQVETQLASVARGLVDKNGKVIVNVIDGTLKLYNATTSTYSANVTTTAQTVGNAVLTVPDMAGVSATVSLASTATLAAGATPAFAPKASISTYLLTPAEAETINATTTGAVAGKVYLLRVLTSGSSSYVITFGTNFKSTGTLTTGVTTAKVFVVAFVYDGTNFCEVSRTTAM